VKLFFTNVQRIKNKFELNLFNHNSVFLFLPVALIKMIYKSVNTLFLNIKNIPKNVGRYSGFCFRILGLTIFFGFSNKN